MPVWLSLLCLQGPIKVTVQELDGSFNHTLQIEENSLKHDIPCHSKSRRYVPDPQSIWFALREYCSISTERQHRETAANT